MEDGPRGHWLSRTRGDGMPRALAALEVDSYAEETQTAPVLRRERLARWAIAYQAKDHHSREKEGRREGTEVQELWQALDALMHRGQCLWVVSHDAPRVWGLCGVWQQLESGGLWYVSGNAHHHSPRQKGAPRPWRGYVAIGDSVATILAQRRGLDGTIQFVDLRNWGAGPSPAGLPVADRAAWVLDVVLRMIDTLRREGLGMLRPTAGSQALFSWRRRHLTVAVHHHENETAGDLERAAYYGGRCECRRLGQIGGPIYHVDYRSAYGAIARDANLPVRLVEVGQGEPPRAGQGRTGAADLLAEVKLRVGRPAYPVRRGGLVLYPTGGYWTILPGPELVAATARGEVSAWGRWARYELAPALRSFATHVLALLDDARGRADLAVCAWLKRLLVSLPGKLGQSDRTWLPLPRPCGDHWWDSWWHIHPDKTVTRARALAGVQEWERRRGWSYHSCAAMACWITSEARVRLWHAIERAGYDHVIYWDTDGILCDETGYRQLPCSDCRSSCPPGALRLCGLYENACIHGIKHYKTDRSIVRAGAPLRGDSVGPEPDHYYVRASLGAEVYRGRAPEVISRLTHFASRAQYKHGRVGDGGWVHPFHFER